MKKLSVMCIIVLLLLSLTGCYTSQAFVKYETMKTDEITDAKKGIVLMLENLEFRLGLFDGILHPYMQDVPPTVTSAIKELKELVDKYHKDKKLSDYDMGRALGIQVRLRGEVAQALLKKYAPGILQYLAI